MGGAAKPAGEGAAAGAESAEKTSSPKTSSPGKTSPGKTSPGKTSPAKAEGGANVFAGASLTAASPSGSLIASAVSSVGGDGAGFKLKPGSIFDGVSTGTSLFSGSGGTLF